MNDINDDYCPSEIEGFAQFPIGGQQAIEQKLPIVQLDDRVNFTAIEIGTQENQTIIFLGDDHGIVHTVKFISYILLPDFVDHQFRFNHRITRRFRSRNFARN